MDLGEARVGEQGALLVGSIAGRNIRGHRVCGQEEDIAVPAGAEDNGVGRMAFDLAGDQVPYDNPPCLAVHQDELEHFPAGIHLDLARPHLAHQRVVGPEQELLPCLPPCVEGPGNLGPAEGPVRKEPAVVAGKGDALGNALIDDRAAHLGKPVDVRLSRPEIAPLDRVVEQTPYAVAVVRVVLGGVDSALGGDAVRPSGAVLDAEGLHIIAKLRERCGCGGPGKPCAHDDDVVLPLVRGVDQLQVETMTIPFFCKRAARDLCI